MNHHRVSTVHKNEILLSTATFTGSQGYTYTEIWALNFYVVWSYENYVPSSVSHQNLNNDNRTTVQVEGLKPSKCAAFMFNKQKFAIKDQCWFRVL